MSNRCWIVKKGRAVYNKRGLLVGRPGDVLPYDDEDAQRQPSAVRCGFTGDELPLPDPDHRVIMEYVEPETDGEPEEG